MNNLIVNNLLFDKFNWNVIEVAINNIVEPIVVIPQRNECVYNQGYVENIIPNYNISEFKAHFRLSRQSFEQLCITLAPFLTNAHVSVSPETKVGTIFHLAVIETRKFFSCE